jgi:hypothetical protein
MVRRGCPPTPLSLEGLLRTADVESVGELHRVIGTLKAAAANTETRGPLVGVVRGDGELDLRVAPASALRAPDSFFCMVRSGLRAADASAVGLVLPVRAIWGEDQVCPYLDAEALVLVAVEDTGAGVLSVGLRCPLHALPAGWEEAHERLQPIARPLRHALAGRSLEEDETL